MTMTYALRLRCPDCGAVVVWENERPDWQGVDEGFQAAVDAAKAWVASYENNLWRFEEDRDIGWDSNRPELVRMGKDDELYVNDPRFVTCPACDGMIYISDHAPTEPPADTTTESPERKAS